QGARPRGLRPAPARRPLGAGTRRPARRRGVALYPGAGPGRGARDAAAGRALPPRAGPPARAARPAGAGRGRPRARGGRLHRARDVPLARGGRGRARDRHDAGRSGSVLPRGGVIRAGARARAPARARRKKNEGQVVDLALAVRTATRYFVMTPQAMRPPLLPVGSAFSSSGFAWITSEVPLPPSRLTGLWLKVKALVVTSMPPSPEAPTTRFGRSPECGPAGFRRPCCVFPGLKCAPAEVNSGGSQRPTAWMCSPWLPGGSR